jgi:hypothetical protein
MTDWQIAQPHIDIPESDKIDGTTLKDFNREASAVRLFFRPRFSECAHVLCFLRGGLMSANSGDGN